MIKIKTVSLKSFVCCFKPHQLSAQSKIFRLKNLGLCQGSKRIFKKDHRVLLYVLYFILQLFEYFYFHLFLTKNIPKLLESQSLILKSNMELLYFLYLKKHSFHFSSQSTPKHQPYSHHQFKCDPVLEYASISQWHNCWISPLLHDQGGMQPISLHQTECPDGLILGHRCGHCQGCLSRDSIQT